jgi:glycosyltransferase involved in cell wall biosynthesis
MMAAGVQAIGALVDIGIPTFGEPRFLVESIESVIGQTIEAWRLTISENGPGSAAVAAAVAPFLSDPRIRHVTTGTNLGGARNSTRLVQAGSAPHVALLHDDDRWAPEFLARRVAFLEANPTCGLVFSSCDFIDDSGSVIHRFKVDLAEGVQDRKRFLRFLYLSNVICMPTVVVRRDCYEAVGPKFNDAVLYYDYEMWLRIASRFDVGYLDVVDASYRIHTGQTTHDIDLKVGDHRLALLDAVDGVLPADFPALQRRRARSGAHMRIALEAHEQGDRPRTATHLRKALRLYPIGFLDPKMASLALGSIKRRAILRRVWG